MKHELGPNSEVSTMLSSAVDRVAILYLSEKLVDRTLYADVQLVTGRVSPDFKPEVFSNQLWEEAAGEFSPFAQNMRGLRDALRKAVYEKQEHYQSGGIGSVAEMIVGMPFDVLDDWRAGCLLKDIMTARSIGKESHDAVNEPSLMFDELYIQDREHISLAQVIAAVLTGQLKLNPQ